MNSYPQHELYHTERVGTGNKHLSVPVDTGRPLKPSAAWKPPGIF
ncbi:MAG TPA: hypothetical protein VHO69_03415 [Phototrophicaceae bacterium]|nr:hypothetical protein [Phototrophicaceae bacterium]